MAVFEAKYQIVAHIYYFSCRCTARHLLWRNNQEGTKTNSRDALPWIDRIWFCCDNCPLSRVSKSSDLGSISYPSILSPHRTQRSIPKGLKMNEEGKTIKIIETIDSGEGFLKQHTESTDRERKDEHIFICLKLRISVIKSSKTE